MQDFQGNHCAIVLSSVILALPSLYVKETFMCEGSTTVKVLFYFLFVLQVLKYSHRFILQEVFIAHGKQTLPFPSQT